MRYFRRGGSGIIVRDGNGVARFINGPIAPTEDSPGEPGGLLAYDTDDPAQASFAEQYANTPGWYETDKDGEPLPPQEPEKPAEPVSEVSQAAPVKSGWMSSGAEMPAHTDEPASAG